MGALAGLGDLAARHAKDYRMPSPHRLSQRSKRPALGAAAVEIGAGIRMHCHEVDDDLAILRFVCAPAPGRAGEPKPGASAGAVDRRRARHPPGES